MYKTAVFLGLGLVGALTGAAHAAEQCDTYTIAKGDTLRLVAERYYGDRALSPIIYEANQSTVGENPNIIEIGMELAIPCRENMQMPEPETAFLAVVPPATPETDTEVAAPEPAALFLASSGQTPFVNQDGTGLIPNILNAALRAGGYGESPTLTRPDSIPEILRISATPDALLSFPWILPNCGDGESLSSQSAYLCDNYTFSAPLYEITLGLFTRADGPLAGAQSIGQFAGSTLCVPQFHTTDMLVQNGILDTSAIIVVAPDIASCIDGLVAGDFTAFVADYQSYKAFAPQDGSMVDLPDFSKMSTLHAIAYSENDAAQAVLAQVNAGLSEILRSGEWFEIINQHLNELTH